MDLKKKLQKKIEWIFLSALLLGLAFLAFFTFRIKKVETKIVNKWCEVGYLGYLLSSYNLSFKKPKLDTIKLKLKNMGIAPEVIQELMSGGIQIRGAFTWRQIAQLLEWLKGNDFQVQKFQADLVSDNGTFKVNMVIK